MLLQIGEINIPSIQAGTWSDVKPSKSCFTTGIYLLRMILLLGPTPTFGAPNPYSCRVAVLQSGKERPGPCWSGLSTQDWFGLGVSWHRNWGSIYISRWSTYKQLWFSTTTLKWWVAGRWGFGVFSHLQGAATIKIMHRNFHPKVAIISISL